MRGGGAALLTLGLCLSAAAGAAAPFEAGDFLVLRTRLRSSDPGILVVDESDQLTVLAEGEFLDFTISRGNVIYALQLDGNILELRPDGERRLIETGGVFDRPSGITVNSHGLFVSDQEAQPVDPVVGAFGRIFEIDPATGEASLLVEKLDPQGSFHAATWPAGHDLETDRNDDLIASFLGKSLRVARISPSDGGADVILDDIEANGMGIWIDPHGGTVAGFAMYGSFNGGVAELDLETGELISLPTRLLPIGEAYEVVLLDDGRILVAPSGFGGLTDYPCPGFSSTRCLARFDPRTGEGETVALGEFSEIQTAPVPEPGSAVVFASGVLLVAAALGRRSRVDRAIPER